jgi:hypothetical protein
MNKPGAQRRFVKPFTLLVFVVLAMTGCSRNHYDTTLTDANVEAVAKRIDLNGNAWGIAELKSILKSESSHPRANLLLAELLFHEDPDNADVSKYLKRASSKHAPMDMRYWAVTTQCRILIHRGNTDEASAIAGKLVADAIKEGWSDEGKTATQELFREVKMADIQFNQERLGIAATLSAAEALVAEAPDHASVRLAYGVMLREAGEWNRAAEQFQIVMAAHADGWLGFASRAGLAKTYFARGDSSQAQQLAGVARKMGAAMGMSEEILNHHLKPIEGSQP